MHKEYLGDSVYAEMDKLRGLILTTENGSGPSNTIMLAPEVLAALVWYLRSVSGNPQWPETRRPGG